MSWVIENAFDSFPKYRQQWDELNKETGNHILLDSRFILPLLKKHTAKNKILFALFRSASDPCMLFLQKTGMGTWSLFQPPQQPIGMVLFATSTQACEKIEYLLRSLPGYGLILGITQQDPDYTHFRPRDAKSNMEFVPYIETGRITLNQDFECYWNGRCKELRDNNARRLRKFDRDGTECKFEELRLPSQMARGVRHYSRMEQSGWKFHRGTAVGLDNSQGLFYREILSRFCESGEGVIYQLLFDGIPAASQLCITRGDVLISLKIAYDEQFRNRAPGFLLQEKIIRHLYTNSNIRVIEFYGRATDGWTRKWTDEIRTMFHVNFYRSSSIRTGIHVLKSIYVHK